MLGLALEDYFNKPDHTYKAGDWDPEIWQEKFNSDTSLLFSICNWQSGFKRDTNLGKIRLSTMKYLDRACEGEVFDVDYRILNKPNEVGK